MASEASIIETLDHGLVKRRDGRGFIHATTRGRRYQTRLAPMRDEICWAIIARVMIIWPLRPAHPRAQLPQASALSERSAHD